MVFQELTLVSEMTVMENVFLNQEPKKLCFIDRRSMKHQLEDAMGKYGINLEPNAIVKNLSVAKQQMAELLKILIRNPELIILDEPTSALAKKEVEQLYSIIRNLIADNKTIIFISHRLEELFAIGDRITVFKDGSFIGTKKMSEMTHDSLIKMMVGRSLKKIFPSPLSDINTAKVIFEVSGLNDMEGKIHDISFQVYHGEILGIAGLQGHG